MTNSSRLRGQIDRSFSEKVQTITDSVKLHENGAVTLTDFAAPFEFSRVVEHELGHSMALNAPIQATLGFNQTTGKLFLESASLQSAARGETAHLKRSASLPSYIPYFASSGSKLKSGYIPLLTRTSDELLEAAGIPPLSKDSTETEVCTWREAVLTRAASWSITSSVSVVHDVDPQLLTVIQATKEEHQESDNLRDVRRVEKIIYTPVEGDEETLTAHAILETETELHSPTSLRAYQRLYLADTSLFGVISNNEPDVQLESVDLLDVELRQKYNDLATDAFKAFVKRAG